ncbi:MAG: copper resistance protein CopC, partial [Gaiellales bacterium]
AIALAPAVAGAHAVLLQTAPTEDGILAEQPMAVQLTFNEPVEAVGAQIRVIAPDGEDFADGEPTASGRTLSILVRDGMPEGTATVAWSAISVDGHRISGAFAFSVGSPSAPAAIDAAGDVLQPAGARWATSALRAVRFGGIVASLGLAAVLLLVWGPAIRRGRMRAAADAEAADAAFRRRILPLAVAAPGILVVATLAWFPVETWSSGLGLGELLSLRQGVVAVASLLAALVLVPLLAATTEGRLPAGPALGLAAILAAAPALAGHAVAQQPSWPSQIGSWAHVVAAGLWAGGVLALALGLPPALRAAGDVSRGDLLAGIVARFTRVALAGLAGLVATGTIAAFVYAGSPEALWASAWGRLVIAKVVVVSIAVALAAITRRRGRGATRALTTEAVLVLVVIAVTGVLTGLAPAGAAKSPAGPMTVTADADGRVAQLSITPGVAGAPNEVHLIVVDARGEPAWDAQDGSVSLASTDVERLPVELTRIEPGHWTGSVVLPAPGRWEATARFRLGEFDDQVVRGTLDAAPSG